MLTRTEVAAANKASRDRANKARRVAHCRCCGKKILENTRSGFTVVPVEDGSATLETHQTDRTFGHHGTGICTARCGLTWAKRHAPSLMVAK